MSYQHGFLHLFKIWSMLNHESVVDRVKNKECNFIFPDIFLAFFVVFHQQICAFIIVTSFLWLKVKILQRNNQSKSGIEDKKLSVELYVNDRFPSKSYANSSLLLSWVIVENCFGASILILNMLLPWLCICCYHQVKLIT